MPKTPTVATIARANSAAGLHYFDRDTLRFFNQRRSDFRAVTVSGRVFVYGRGRPWGIGDVHAWSVAEFDPATGRTHSVDGLPHSLTMNRNTTAADIRLALRAVADNRATCPTANGHDLEIWDTVKAEMQKVGA
jgi:hypothetical protein